MAGLIRINENEAWSAAGWVFDSVLRVTRRHLPKTVTSKIVELMDRAEIPGVGYMSLVDLTPSEIQIFREALESAYQEQLRLGSNSFAEPTFYPGYMKNFQELLEMIRRS